jgi:hypothetical protein
MKFLWLRGVDGALQSSKMQDIHLNDIIGRGKIICHRKLSLLRPATVPIKFFLFFHAIGAFLCGYEFNA